MTKDERISAMIGEMEQLVKEIDENYRPVVVRAIAFRIEVLLGEIELLAHQIPIQ